MEQGEPTRTAAIWVPDWPVIAAMRAADLSPHLPAVIMTHHGVMAASAAARATGIRRGMRKRTAQGHCPSVVLLPADEERDAAQFEPVAAAAEQVVSGLEVMRPGLALVPFAGAARYYGGEAETAQQLVEAVSYAGFECQVGVADGILAAVLAAREDRIVPAGGSAAYLADKPITDLLNVAVGPKFTAELTEVISLWARLGLPLLGDLVALPSDAMAGRFGHLGVWAQRLARGEDLRPPALRRHEDEPLVSQSFDPPLYRVESAVVVGRELADRFVDLMLQRSLACGRVRISATTAEGVRSRVWRTDEGAIGGMNAAAIAQRLRWQLESWLTAANLAVQRVPERHAVAEFGEGAESFSVGADFADHPAPILAIEIAAEEVVAASAYQTGLWGGASGQDIRAHRALSNVQGILGVDKVLSVALRGERTPQSREVKAAFGEPIPDLKTTAAPWPAALPDPAPSLLYQVAIPARLLTESGVDILLDVRTSQLTQSASSLVIANQKHQVSNWAGPWLIPQNWWEGNSIAVPYLQVVLENGDALLLAHRHEAWEVVGRYH